MTSHSTTKTNKQEEVVEINFESIQKFVINHIKNNYVYYVLFALFLLALYIRTLPNIGSGYLQAIDPYYMLRMTQTLLENNFVLPAIDYMRYYPTGYSPHNELYLLYYIYAFIYALIKPFGVSFISYAQLIPAILGASYVFWMYGIGKELFNNKLAGIFSAFIFTVSGAVLYRSSEGFFEKEPLSGFFILGATYFIIKAIKQPEKSITYGIASGIFTAFAYGTWGGAILLLYLIPAYYIVLTFLSKINKYDFYAYTSWALTYWITLNIIYHFRYSLISTSSIYVFGTALLMGGLLAISYKNKTFNKYRVFTYPGVMIGAVLVLLISALFSSTSARVVKEISRLIVYKKQVIESTVAENIPANIDMFLRSFGVISSNIPEPLTYLLSPWMLIIIGGLLIIWKELKDVKYEHKLALSAIFIISVIAYYAFLATSGANTLANIAYVIIAASMIIYLLLHNKRTEAFIFLFAYATMLMYVTKVRISYAAGLYVSFIIGYALAALTHYTVQLWKNNNISLKTDTKSLTSTIKFLGSLIGIMYLVAFAYTNITFAQNAASAMSYGEMNDAWKDALNYMKTSLPQNSVILSWWDFGYWFQTLGNKTTLLDGGNQLSIRNVFAAKYFTSRYNESYEALYLYLYRPTHILVDYTMIGKYAAMSKIANNGKWIDAYAQLQYGGIENNLQTYYLGANKIYVPLTENGTYDITKPIIMTPTYTYAPTPIKYLCTPYGLIDTLLFYNASQYINECIYIIPGYPQVAFMTFHAPNAKTDNYVYNSNFHKLYIENGQRIPYVNKTYDNFMVKIYEINYTYIDNIVEQMNLTDKQIEHLKEVCIYDPARIKECPLYYDKIDLS